MSTDTSTCSRCGGVATARFSDTSLCASCLQTAQWESIVTAVQDAYVQGPVAKERQAAALPRSA